MNIYDSQLWIKDMDRIYTYLTELPELEGSTVMITGASGLVGASIVYVLIRYNETHQKKIRIVAAGRLYGKMEQCFGSFINRDYFHFIPYDALKTNNDINISADYIIHGAGNASPDMISKEPVETLLGNVSGLNSLFNYARSHETKRILYISSSEVYGQKSGDQPFKENEYGYIDILNPRNSYAVGKCAGETLCASYASEYDMETVIVRPGHIYGPTASVHDGRVGSLWAYSAAKGDDIILKSDGSQIRSYVYCLDCASAILKVLLAGDNCHAYNISNPNSIITIRELGEKLAEAGGVNLRMEKPSDIETKRFNPMQNSSLEADSLMKLGWRGCFDADEGLSHTVAILKEKLML